MDLPRMSVSEVADHVRAGDPVTFLDSRSPNAYEQATDQIPGSIRVPPTDIDEHLGEIPIGDRLIVSYCT